MSEMKIAPRTRREFGQQLLATPAFLGGTVRAHPGPPAPARRPLIRIDHHVHLHAPEILAFMPLFCESIARFGKCDSAIIAPLTVSDLLRQMNGAGVERALVLSTAYLAESPMMTAPAADHLQRVRAANDFTVGLAKRFPRRFGAFISVNPLSETALPEINRWRGNAHVAGLKLHLTSSLVDLHSQEHLQRLAAVIRAASEKPLRRGHPSWNSGSQKSRQKCPQLCRTGHPVGRRLAHPDRSRRRMGRPGRQDD